MELLAPAGNFEIGIYALQAGADALYLGLKDFSARKFADNFSLDDLRRIKEFSSKKSKKIFCTINTLIEDCEVEKMLNTLLTLQTLEIDGVILQDLGLLDIIKRNFPKIKIHASTQMSIHNNQGLNIAKSEGISRVVLSRELPFEYIKYLRNQNPSIELEVFIHGALCYSFSGMCLWSGLELDRSANRGECAQICRNYFETEDKSKKYLFSCNDLSLGEDILRLKEIGINSLKIEGRMKDASYVVSTVKYYRSILESEINSLRINHEARLQSQIAFSRKSTKGYFNQVSGNDLINPNYTGHMGIAIGKLKDINYSHNEVKIELDNKSSYKLSPNDTLLIVSDAKKWRFNAFQLKVNNSQTIATLKINGDISQDAKAHNLKNLPVYVTQSNTLRDQYPHLDYKNYPLYYLPLPLSVNINQHQITLLVNHNPYWNKPLQFEYEINIDHAQNKKSLHDTFIEMFGQAKDSLFKIASIKIDNQTPWASDEIFIPLSNLKKIKNDFYQKINSLYNEIQLEYLNNIIRQTNNDCPKIASPYTQDRPLPHKEKWPFVSTRILNAYHDNFDKFFNQDDIDNLKDDKFIYLPLMPIQFDEIYYNSQLIKLIDRITKRSPGNISRIVVGINNLSHLRIASQLIQHYPKINFYLDIYAYAANTSAYHFWRRKLSNISFFFGHIDHQKNKTIKNVPLFISCGCIKKHTQSKFTEIITNNKSKYKILTEDCVTIVMPLF